MKLVSEPALSGCGARKLFCWQAGILFALIAWLYVPIAWKLTAEWWQDPNYHYGFFVPLFSLLLVWEDRAKLSTLQLRPCWSGLLILLMALASLMIGVFGAGFFLARISLLLLISGLIVFFAGWRHLLVVSFPLAFLILMVPSSSVLHHVIFHLQIMASISAGCLLKFAGISVIREGNILSLPGVRLQVAEACSGLQSLFSLLMLAIAYGYLVERTIRVRVLVAVLAVPTSVAANAVRIATAGILAQHWGLRSAQGMLHIIFGWLVFVGSLATLFTFHSLLQSVFVMRNHGEQEHT
jgi:exosortase